MQKARLIDDLTEYVARHTTDAAALEQAAEECTELAKACIKAARVMRGESPTPVALKDALEEVTAEVNDVLNLLCVLHEKFPQVTEVMTMRLGKMQRWHDRLEAVRG